jgi:hypothetical protein
MGRAEASPKQVMSIEIFRLYISLILYTCLLFQRSAIFYSVNAHAL